MRLKVLICDVDGTLVDSAAHVVACVRAAYAEQGLASPPAARIRAQIGLSLDVMFQRLDAGIDAAQRDALVDGYKRQFRISREQDGSSAGSPLFPGARAALDRLQADPSTLLAVATGKSRRGLDALLADHDLRSHFVSLQTADQHPSKPNPSMIEAILAETGATPKDAIMLGDTSYDVEMAHGAGVRAIAVEWGYHPAADLGADRVISTFAELRPTFEELLELT